jgi:hypothetical protein
MTCSRNSKKAIRFGTQGIRGRKIKDRPGELGWTRLHKDQIEMVRILSFIPSVTKNFFRMRE